MIGSMRTWHYRWDQRLTKVRRLTWVERQLLMEVLLLLVWARLLLFLPFSFTVQWFSFLDRLPAPAARQTPSDIQALCDFLVLRSRSMPWHSRCLERAIAGKLLLQRRGIRADLYLGVRKQGAQLDAHAWLIWGGMVPIGAVGHQRFTPVWHSGHDQGAS